jgi:hypothetical protein
MPWDWNAVIIISSFPHNVDSHELVFGLIRALMMIYQPQVSPILIHRTTTSTLAVLPNLLVSFCKGLYTSKNLEKVTPNDAPQMLSKMLIPSPTNPPHFPSTGEFEGFRGLFKHKTHSSSFIFIYSSAGALASVNTMDMDQLSKNGRGEIDDEAGKDDIRIVGITRKGDTRDRQRDGTFGRSSFPIVAFQLHLAGLASP